MSTLNYTISQQERLRKAAAVADERAAERARNERNRSLPPRALIHGDGGDELLRDAVQNGTRREVFLGDVRLTFKTTAILFAAERVTARISREESEITLVSSCGQTLHLRYGMHRKLGLVIEKVQVHTRNGEPRRRTSSRVLA